MGDAKLEKINKRLYHEPYKDGKPFKWAKHLEFLSIKFTNIRAGLGLSIERPETSISFALDETDSEEGINKNKATGDDDETTEKYTESFGWRITAVGLLDNRRIGLIKKDGTRTIYGEDHDRVDVILRPIAEDHKEKAVGALFYHDGEMLKWEDRSKPYFTLELPVPEIALEKLCREIVEGRLSELHLGVRVDVFQSEVDRGLAEPWMRQEYYIEEDSILNRAYLSSVSAYQAAGNGNRAGGSDKSEEDIENEDENERLTENASKTSLNDLFALQTEATRIVAQQLRSIRVVGILIAATLFLMLLFK